MAIIKTKHSEFTGHVGPVAFDKGRAETDLVPMVAHFKRDPERYEVTEDKPKRQRGKRGKAGEKADDKAGEGAKGADESAEQPAEGPEAGDESDKAADGDDGKE